MYKRLIILSLIILMAIGGLTWLGYRSIEMWANGLAGARLGEFAAVADQIREDVKLKLDEFMQTEQQRPYTDYQYYYVPENFDQNLQQQKQQLPLLRSPLAGKFYNDLAAGYFQINPDGSIVTPYFDDNAQVGYGRKLKQNEELRANAQRQISNIKSNLMPTIEAKISSLDKEIHFDYDKIKYEPIKKYAEIDEKVISKQVKLESQAKSEPAKSKKSDLARSSRYRIESLEQSAEEPKVFQQQTEIANKNLFANRLGQMSGVNRVQAESIVEQMAEHEDDFKGKGQQQTNVDISVRQKKFANQRKTSESVSFSDMKESNIQIRVEPFAPVMVGPANDNSLFDGQVFLLRHVQIADQHFMQGFKLNEEKLLGEISDSAKRFMREGMDFCLDKYEREDSAHSAFLDFGFGTVVLNLLEMNPDWVNSQVEKLRKWYFAIVSIVVLAMLIVIVSLWRNMRAQVKLARKKDDFISAVSHELRTPLTSIRMYSEMLEKNWVKSPDKTQQYYKNMRQESERLSRLIENVLDFSRIQKGRKKYTFNLGNVNECVSDVINMVDSYVSKAGFKIETQLQELKPIVFDEDAVTQIIVNLIDNAVKYAADSKDKILIVRTKQQGSYVLIEVEDHGPGIAHTQKKKVFDVFYRCQEESTRQAKGTGLGLALVKRFTEAHDGFVEILNAKPNGAIFRIAISSELQS